MPFRVIALDLAEHRTGWAEGPSDAYPKFGVVQLRGRDERSEDAAATLACWLRDRFEQERPDLVAIEHYLRITAMQGFTTAAIVEAQIGLSFVVRAVAACYGIPVRAPEVKAIREFFCGAATAAPIRRGPNGLRRKRTNKERSQDSDATKRMVWARAVLLGYLPKDLAFEGNISDAIALFDFAANRWGGRIPSLCLFELPMRRT